MQHAGPAEQQTKQREAPAASVAEAKAVSKQSAGQKKKAKKGILPAKADVAAGQGSADAAKLEQQRRLASYAKPRLRRSEKGSPEVREKKKKAQKQQAEVIQAPAPTELTKAQRKNLKRSQKRQQSRAQQAGTV